MPIRQLTQQEYARLIAKQKGIKYKSAMRYIQRARAPEGKQRIKQPRFIGIKPALRAQLAGFIETERKRLQPQDWYDKYLAKLKKLGDDVKSGRLVLRKPVLPEGELLDKIAVLTNLFNYDDASNILDVDEDLLHKATQGIQLNRLEQAELNEQYYHLVRDEDLQTDYDVDINYVESQAAILRDQLRAIEYADSIQTFREAVAIGAIDLEKLEKNVGLVKSLTRSQLRKILNKWSLNHTDIDLNEMLDAFEADDGKIMGDVNESEFWAWFRELFY